MDSFEQFLNLPVWEAAKTPALVFGGFGTFIIAVFKYKEDLKGMYNSLKQITVASYIKISGFIPFATKKEIAATKEQIALLQEEFLKLQQDTLGTTKQITEKLEKVQKDGQVNNITQTKLIGDTISLVKNLQDRTIKNHSVENSAYFPSKSGGVFSSLLESKQEKLNPLAQALANYDRNSRQKF